MASKTARHLRKTPTEAEQRLWSVLRRRQLAGARFRRQVPLGPYVADFACFSHRLVVEVDGGQHNLSQARDGRRARWLESQGYWVIRFWNNEVDGNLEGVTETIRLALRNHTPHPNPPPQGGRG
ncbi:MAG: endonuclease domain-containing protein [Rhodospirillales bacterium]|nr:endonuclease domain-containing protein [Rhodospirillales bacterium]MDH3790287.1 endonuclease domain-containing protein [Rhodospirillales bacterium]MDH3909668.1 endonuclease domain-containing protein [Rhodospirillales bacterium]MDH3916605.1 endonuclease domain-containing protein [Rhodospirillales bacterium]MDH3965751.1 endonuclease domain-containing protein [Rhodospirillales bacterium]